MSDPSCQTTVLSSLPLGLKWLYEGIPTAVFAFPYHFRRRWHRLESKAFHWNLWAFCEGWTEVKGYQRKR